MLEFGYGTHGGLRKRYNEDTYCIDAARGIFLVADGLGDGVQGATCAAQARDALLYQLKGNTNMALDQALRTVARTLAAKKDHLTQMAGSTLLALRLDAQHFEASWVGSDKLFLLHQELYALATDVAARTKLFVQGILYEEIPDDTADDTPAEDVASKPKAQEPTAAELYNAHMHALGVTALDQLHIEYLRGHLRPGMQFLLATDGLTEHVSPARIGYWLQHTDMGPQEVVDNLILEALEHGGNDNITAILVRQSPLMTV